MKKKIIEFLRIDDFKKIKWKNMKIKEKKFIIVTVIFAILLIFSLTIGYYSNYIRILNNPTVLDKFIILKIDEIKIYFPYKELINILKSTPNAKEIADMQLYILLAILLVIYILLALPIEYIKKDVSCGSARWGKFDDLGLSGFLIPKLSAKAFELNLLEESGVVLGEINKRIIHDNGKTHILLSAPTRTGKGVSIIIPTLVDTWKDSVFVLDIKGENYQMTSGWRKREFNNKILKFSPKKNDSAKFNPLEEIRFLTDKEIEDAKVIADLIVIDEGGGEPFWGIAGSDFCSCVVMYVLYKNRHNTKNKGSLGDVVKFITDPSAPLINRMKMAVFTPLFDLNDDKDKEIIEKLLKIYHADEEVKLLKKGFHPFVSNGFADTINKGEKTMASIVATAKAKLSVFESPTVNYNTSSSDFRIIDLMASDKPYSLYIVIEPGDLQNLAPLLRILVIQCVTLLTPEMDYTGNNKNAMKFNYRLLMLLDEFPSLGKMEILEKAIGYVAGYGMKMMIVVQSLDQLNKIYTKDNMFLSNCQTQVFYTANDNQTAEYISKTIGQETIKQKSISSNGGGLFNKNYSFSKTGRDLIKPDEMRRFPLDKILLLIGGKPPIISNKILFFADKRFKNKVKIPLEKTESMKNEIENNKKIKK